MSVANGQHDHSRHVVAWTDLIAQPWRNGGGITRQILSRRRGDADDWVPCTDDDWEWRLSIADVEHAGPFSRYDKMTRIITVIEGESVALTVDGTTETLERHRPFTFDGGAETRADLPHGPIRDLNLIARTDVANAAVSVEVLRIERPYSVSEGQYCVLLQGQALLGMDVSNADSVPSTGVELGLYDTVLGDAGHPWTVTGEGILAVVSVAGIAVAGVAATNSAPSPSEPTGLR